MRRPLREAHLVGKQLRGKRSIAIVLCTVAIFAPTTGAIAAARSSTDLVDILPSALYTANPPGSPVLVTEAQAARVAKTMWPLLEDALIQKDFPLIDQLVAPGVYRKGVTGQCKGTDLTCIVEPKPHPFKLLGTVVPAQRAYPLDFLTETRTTFPVLATDETTSVPGIELQIFTKTSRVSSWRVAFDTDYSFLDPKLVLLPPFTMTVRRFRGFAPSEFNARATIPTGVAAPQLLADLAIDYGSLFNTGTDAPNNPFSVIGGAHQYGQGIEATDKLALGASNIGSEVATFAEDPAAGLWTFTLSGRVGVCGTVLESTTFTPNPGTSFQQNAERTMLWGQIPPGTYLGVSAQLTRPTCIFWTTAGYDASGNDGYVLKAAGIGS
jgi:hypothetical protein